MENDASGGGTVWKVATISLGMIASGACAYSFILYSSLSTELAAARSDSSLAHNEIASLRSELNSTEAQADAVQRSGEVAVLHNLAGADLEVMLEVRSPASGEHIRRPLVINAHGLLEIGAAQGWRFAPGQIVTLENDRYRPIVRIVS